MELGKKIAALRKSKNITQAQLAEYLSVNPQTVSRWEAEGGTPDVMLLPRISSFFGVTLDELFGITDMEQINNLVYKYSVLRDENTFKEVMHSMEIALNSLSVEEQEAKDDKKQEIKQKIQQIKAWKVHIYIQKSRSALEQADKELDVLREEIDIENPLYIPLKLQKQQFRIQMGDAGLVLKQTQEEWQEKRNMESLYCFMAALFDMQKSGDILQLWETEEVQGFVESVTEKNKALWQMMFESSVMEQNLDYFENYYEKYKESASDESMFEVKWLSAKLYHVLGMEKEKETRKEELLNVLENMKYNAYIKEMYRIKLETL